MLGGAAASGGDELLTVTVTVVRDDHGYGMKVSGDNPVYVQSVKEHGAAWRAGLRSGDRILRVDNLPVTHHSHQQVVQMIRANPTTVLTVHQSTSRLKTPITAPVPANLEQQRQFEASKVKTMRLMLDKEQKYIRDLRNELLKVPDVRKSAELESAEQRCSTLQREIDVMMGSCQLVCQPTTPRNVRTKNEKVATPTPNTGFLSGLPRSLSNLTGQSLRNLRQARQKQENQPPLVRQNSDESNNKRRIHNNTVPMVPTTCLDNSPPPLPPRSIERPKRNPTSPITSPISPPINPLAKNKYYNKRLPDTPNPFSHQSPLGINPLMSQSVPSYEYRRSSHSLDGELDGPQPNSIALQMSYPLVNVPPPPLQMDNRNSVPVFHMRSRSSPEQLDHDLSKSFIGIPSPLSCHSSGGVTVAEGAARDTPPPGTPPPPYHTNTQPCADPQRAIISMEEDDSPASDTSSYSGLFSNLRSVRESKARTAVLLNWLLGERRCACACLLLVLTDGYRSGAAPLATLRRWAYEIHSAFLMPNAVLQLSGVDENMANEIEHVLVNEYEKEELLRNVFRKARQKAKEELAAQLSEFQVKRQVGLATFYGPEDSVIDKCLVDKIQEQTVVERLMCEQLRQMSAEGRGGLACARAGPQGPTPAGPPGAAAHQTLLAALAAAALCLQCRPAAVASAAGTQRAAFLQRDKLYKQRVKHITKQHQQPFVVRGHHLQLQALTSVAHCHKCDDVIRGLAPQAYYCTDCKLRVHRACAKEVDEPCCIDADHHNNRISRFMERIHHNNMINSQDSADKKSRKASGTANFLNMERSFRKAEDEQPWEQTPSPATIGETRREGSSEEPSVPDADVDTSDTVAKEAEKDNTWRSAPPPARGVNRAESCRERDAPRRGKHRNASDPNRLTAHNNNDLEPGSATAPSGSSSSSSLSSRSNESNTVPAEQQASQSELSDEEEALASQWTDSIPPHVLSTLALSARLRKRQEVIHELIVSEGSHVRWLKVLGRVFLRPLEGQSTLLPPEELKALFPNLPSVRDRHVRLYSELRALRSDVDAPLVDVRAVADAMLNTLGEAGYASTLARFCRGQRMALEALRERRRKNKDLAQFLNSREQLPLCGRLQLRDLLACVWQRLTKYQLLLESVLKTVETEDSSEAERVQRALCVAKEVLHSVDTAIRTAENEHRLRSIQSKLEVRLGSGGGGEWEELRRIELSAHALRLEGDLAIRNDSNKKIHVLALMLEEFLLLLQREGDKFLLKPIPQPSQPQHLSPLIKWDKVLFRPNAAVRNTFFLMNINGVQMHELSANSASEYATWVKHIQEAPLAKLTDLKPTITPSHQATRSADDSGINVSRNPSDASEKSNSTVEDECEKDRLSAERAAECERERESAERAAECERERISAERNSAECERERMSVERSSMERDCNEERQSVEKEDEKEEKHFVRRPTEGRISTHDVSPPLLEPRAALTVTEPTHHTAVTALSNRERLRRLDAGISRCLRAKALVVGDMLGVPARHYSQVADLAVAEALGQVDVSGELRARAGGNGDGGAPEVDDEPDVQQLLLAACTQANQLTLLIRGALSVSESSGVAARALAGRCDTCRRRRRDSHTHAPVQPTAPDETDVDDTKPAELRSASLEEYDTLLELSASREDDEDALESPVGAAQLATRLLDVNCGLQGTLARLLASAASQASGAARAERAALREANDALRARLRIYEHQAEEITFPKADPTTQDQPSNGG